MAPIFFDTHAHLHYPDFVPDLAEVVQRARDAGVSRIVTVGTDLVSSRRSVEIADTFPDVYAAVGWHPSDAALAPEDIRPALLELARHPRVVAIGETGMDYYRLPSFKGGTVADDDALKRHQARLFLQHLEVAAEVGLNCIIHQREALEDTMKLLKPFSRKVRGVFHCFSNDAATMQRVFELGSIVSFTGILTFKSAQTIRDSLLAAPLGKFMLETDCPYLSPVPFRGKRCEPAYVANTAQAAALVKGCDIEALSAATCATAEQFFTRRSF